jgi:hypothetical protein
LFGGDAADGMGDGIVGMEEIQFFVDSNLDHLGRDFEPEHSGWNSVVRHGAGFVVKYIVEKFTLLQAKGYLVADEMNLMAEFGHFTAEFSGNDSAAAVSGKTCDTDSQGLGHASFSSQ